MSALGQCPSCAGNVEFRFATAFVATCTYCGATVARNDRGLEDLGKRSDVVASESGLEPFRKGSYRGVSFTLMGRVVLAHPKGGRWSEWYAAMEDGTIGWLAEAQGVFSFQEAHDGGDALAGLRWETLAVGTALTLAGHAFTVTERSTKTALASEGEVPFVPSFDTPEPFADLVADGGFVATIDFASKPPMLFVGRQVQLSELGIDVRPGRRAAREVNTASVSCGNCGGPIRLHVPDATRRVTCAACGSLHEVDGENFRFLETLEQTRRPPLALGTRFRRENVEWQVVGWMERSVTSEGIRYPWNEYLAYEAGKGFRWLVEAKGHWLWATPAPTVALARPTEALPKIFEGGRPYVLFAHDTATVDTIAGEFPWEVAVGETIECFDYVAGTEVLSLEADAHEMNWTRGEHVEQAEILKAFPGAKLPAVQGVGMVEPNPYRGVGKLLLRFYAAAFVIALGFLIFRPRHELVSRLFALPEVAASVAASASEGVVLVTEPFELQGKRRVEVEVRVSPPVNSYADVVGDLLDEHDVAVASFRAASYAEPDDDGDGVVQAEAQAALAAVEPGTYRLRLDVIASSPSIREAHVLVHEGGVSYASLVGNTLLVSALAGVFGILFAKFEISRYGASDFNSEGRRSEGVAPSTGDDDDSGPASDGGDSE